MLLPLSPPPLRASELYRSRRRIDRDRGLSSSVYEGLIAALRPPKADARRAVGLVLFYR